MFKYILMVFTGACCYGILSTLVKLTYREGYNAAQVSFLQALLGALVLWIIVFIKEKSKLQFRATFPVLLAGAAIGCTTWLYYLSVQYIDASVAIIMLMQFTWITVALDWLILKNAPDARLISAILFILTGTLLAAGIHDTQKTVSLKGLLMGFGSAVAYALYIVANSRAGLQMPSILRSAIMVTGAVLFIAVVNFRLLSTGITTSGVLWKWISLLTLFGTIIPPLLFARGIPKIGASLSSVLMVAEMPVALICARLVLHEQVLPLQWAGIVLMLGAILYLKANRK